MVFPFLSKEKSVGVPLTGPELLSIEHSRTFRLLANKRALGSLPLSFTMQYFIRCMFRFCFSREEDIRFVIRVLYHSLTCGLRVVVLHAWGVN